MTRDLIKSVLNRVPSWPQERQRELAEFVLQIEAELAGSAYHATKGELQAIDEGLTGGTASDEEIDAAFATFRRA